MQKILKNLKFFEIFSTQFRLKFHIFTQILKKFAKFSHNLSIF